MLSGLLVWFRVQGVKYTRERWVGSHSFFGLKVSERMISSALPLLCALLAVNVLGLHLPGPQTRSFETALQARRSTGSGGGALPPALGDNVNSWGRFLFFFSYINKLTIIFVQRLALRLTSLLCCYTTELSTSECHWCLLLQSW